MYGLLIALVVLVALAWLLDSNILEPATTETGSVTPTLAPLWTADPASINLIRIEDLKSKTQVEVQKNSQGTWLVMDLPAVEAVSTTMDTAATNMANLTILRDYGTDLDPKEFGLAEPAYLLTVQTSTGQKFELEIGAANPTGTGYYVRMKNDPKRIVGVSKTLLSGIIDWLTTKPIPPTITPTFTVTSTVTSTPTATPPPSATPTAGPTDTPTVAETPGPGTPVLTETATATP
jgi:hypothetical protein